MKERLGQEPAFPVDEYGYINEDMPLGLRKNHLGMSKRFYAACAAMQGLLANQLMIDNDSVPSIEWVSKTAYRIADELLKQENE